MTHAIVRGAATKAQEYLEGVIKELVTETRREHDRHSVSRILFKCLRDNPERVAIIDGLTDESATNLELLRSSIQVARALASSGLLPGDVVSLVGWNHLQYAAAYYGSIFAGLTLFCAETLLTPYELKYYFNLTKPKIVFVDANKANDVRLALEETSTEHRVVVFGEEVLGNEYTFSKLVQGHSSDDVNEYWPVELQEDAVSMLFTTGGSTGLGPPKLVPITHAGIVAQAPTEWTYDEHFPHPTEMCLLLFNGQWLVHTKMFVTAVIYGATLLVQPERQNADNNVRLLRKYKPTWMIIDPVEMNEVLRSPNYETGNLHSLRKLVLVGLTPYQNLIEGLRKEVSSNIRICNRYGMTEAHGYICLGDQADLSKIGPVVNIFDYKLVDQEGNTVTTNNNGELYLKSKYCLPKTYYGDKEAAANMYTEDGWFRTGDVMAENEQGEMHFMSRLKFIIYKHGYPISPHELEETLCSVEGVAKAVVCGTERGPAALVIPQKGMTPTRKEISETFQRKLNEYKYLCGGVAFVEKLPRTHVGKIHRRKCAEILKELIDKKECY